MIGWNVYFEPSTYNFNIECYNSRQWVMYSDEWIVSKVELFHRQKYCEPERGLNRVVKIIAQPFYIFSAWKCWIEEYLVDSTGCLVKLEKTGTPVWSEQMPFVSQYGYS